MVAPGGCDGFTKQPKALYVHEHAHVYINLLVNGITLYLLCF